MCGIAGFIGRKHLPQSRIGQTLERMRNRGPDAEGYLSIEDGETVVDFLHRRLSIIDLDARSNQPFIRDGCSLIYNGEIYNYLELKKDLEKLGFKFETTSDTEVLLCAYLAYGEKCVEHFEGMWSFALYDRRKHQLFLSRDRFGEKPLYYIQTAQGLYFGSEIKFLSALVGKPLDINTHQVLRYMVHGYKSLYKKHETFYSDVKELPSATNASVNYGDAITLRSYWKPKVLEQRLSEAQAIEGVRERLIESVRIRLRSDVPLAFCLSGGVDSGSIVSIAAKKFNCKIACYSIIDPDPRYNELDNIEATVKDLGCQTTKVTLESSNSLDRLRELIAYHDCPLATISYYVHSFLSQAIARDGFKVVFSGTSADELFTGYFDHFNLHLYEMRHRANFTQYLNDWQTHIAPVVRNPYLQNPRLYFDNPTERRHVYLGSEEFRSYLRVPFDEGWQEAQFCSSLLRNRMLNELFYGATPVVLHEDDLNSMKYSLENRSPLLDTRLFEFACSIPCEYLIQDGFGKHVLREAMSGILNDQVRLCRHKKGFNAAIESIFDLKSPEFRALVLDQSPIFDLIDRTKVEAAMNRDKLPNSFSKFLFSFINSKIFLEVGAAA